MNYDKTFSIDRPLRLAVGSHQAGSGMGCAMNLVSWENGDTTITDLPACVDELLARIVQRVNDRICTHRDGDLLCPACSMKVLELAYRTVGTGGPVDLDRRRVWVRVAADQARQVLHLVRDQGAALRAIEAAEAWAADPSEANRKAASAAAATAPAPAYAAATAAATSTAKAAAVYASFVDADAWAAANAAADAFYASIADADAWAASKKRLWLAHRAIDVFQQLTGHVDQAPDPARTEATYAVMVAR